MGECYDKRFNRYLLHVPETLPLQIVRSSGVRHQLKGLGAEGKAQGRRRKLLGIAVLNLGEFQHQIPSSELAVGFHSQPSYLLGM